MGMGEWSVYKHTTPSGKVYIGITRQKPVHRWGKCGNGYKGNKHFYSAIKKYGWDSIIHEIVCEGLSQEKAEDIERKLIYHYQSYKREFGYNRALGGHALSKESRKKIGETRKKRGIKPWSYGKHLSEATKAKLSKAHTGRRFTISEEGRRNIANAKRGNKNPNYGRPLSEERKQQLIERHQKPVYQIDGDKKVLFISAKEAGDKTGIAKCNITRVCKGQRATAGGYRWEYAI